MSHLYNIFDKDNSGKIDFYEFAAICSKLSKGMPLMKFGMGCVSYLGSVIVLSWKDQSYSPSGEALFFRLLCLVIGVMSMSTVLMTCVVIFGKEALPKRKPPKRLTRVAPH